MLLNNIELDIKTKCIEGSKTQAKIAEKPGTTSGYISGIVNNKLPRNLERHLDT